MQSHWVRSGLLLSCLVASSAQATVLLDWSVETLMQKADLVVVATVLDQQSFEAENTLMTRTRLRIERVVKGRGGSELEVLQLGGRVGDRIVDVPGDAQLHQGKTYLLFTHQPDGQPYRALVGMSLGAFELKGDQLTQVIEVPLLDPTGALLPPPGSKTRKLSDIVRIANEVNR